MGMVRVDMVRVAVQVAVIIHEVDMEPGEDEDAHENEISDPSHSDQLSQWRKLHIPDRQQDLQNLVQQIGVI
jgi:hypothetical protein